MSPMSAPRLNADCHCLPIDPGRIESLRETLSPDAARALGSNLFAPEPVFASVSSIQAIEKAVAALYERTHDPGYQFRALSRAPAIAAHEFGPSGAFMAYDFHLDKAGRPALIEVNTNGGGALLHARMHDQPDQVFLDMFRSEWAAQRAETPLRRVVIVDADPQKQPMYPEFELFVQLFEAAGLEATIASPEELRFDGELWHGPKRIDLVYNRLTDFYLEEPASRALHDAYTSGAVVVTPHPRAHALHADKRNLVDLDLPSVPECRPVEPDLWKSRKSWYFKPSGGYGSRGVYRGAKITRTRWAEVLADGNYVAQREVPPPLRSIVVDGEARPLKYDIRAYAYRGEVQLLAARLFRGQTTNLRTPGGGFARVLAV